MDPQPHGSPAERREGRRRRVESLLHELGCVARDHELTFAEISRLYTHLASIETLFRQRSTYLTLHTDPATVTWNSIGYTSDANVALSETYAKKAQ